jgi:hypothetical protein
MTEIDEGAITPVGVKSGLNPQQRQADQLPALFRPRKIKALGSATDPQHPMQGMAVGASEAVDQPQTALAERMTEVEEDMLGRVKRDLNNYLDKLASRHADDGQRKPGDRGDKLGDKDINDAGLKPAQQDLCVETVAMEDGSIMTIHGDDNNGYEIRRGDRRMAHRFPRLDHAHTALELYRARRRTKDQSQDYVEER